jgi:predicted transcriptional regulator
MRKAKMVRRSEMEIHMDILRTVSEGRHKRTHIMYGANLDWYRVMAHIDSLVKQNLLKKMADDESTGYSLTQRGKEVLEYYKRFENKLYERDNLLPYEVYGHNELES